MVDPLSLPAASPCPAPPRCGPGRRSAAPRAVGLALAALGCLASAGAGAAAPQVQALDPWVQAAPPKARVLAAYMALRNAGSAPQTLVGAGSSAFAQVELHRTVMHGEMAHMEAVAELALPPGRTVVLKPGGLHFMLIDPMLPLAVGTRVPITLRFADGSRLAVEAVVRAPAGKGANDGVGADHAAHEGHAK
jgi:copper(I)-binding protein